MPVSPVAAAPWPPHPSRRGSWVDKAGKQRSSHLPPEWDSPGQAYDESPVLYLSSRRSTYEQDPMEGSSYIHATAGGDSPGPSTPRNDSTNNRGGNDDVAHQQKGPRQLSGRSSSGGGGGSGWRGWPRVGPEDLEHFEAVVAPVEGQLLSGSIGHGWSLVMDKEISGKVRYVSYQRPTPQGTTDYLSLTIAANTSPVEFDEFTLDDEARPHWEGFLKHSCLLAVGDLEVAEQLVAWRRSFPFGFLGDRCYTIARRTWAGHPSPGCVTSVSKVVSDPVVDAWVRSNYPGVVRCEGYFSAWRCSPTANPWGGPGPAVATLLLHRDELKVPEYLARTAIRYGMWRFVREMVTVAGDWVAERRSRVGPDDPDPEAFSRRSADPSLLRPHHALVSPGPVTPGDTGDTNGSPARRPLLLSVPTAPADLSAMGGADALSSSSSAGSGLSGVTSVTSSGASSVLSLSEYYGTAGMAPLEQGLGGGVGRIAAAIQKQQAAAAAGAGAAGGATSAHQQQHHQRHQGGGRGDAPRSNIVRSHSLTWEPTDETYSSIIRAHAIAFTPRASQQPMRQAPPFSANTHQQWGQVPVSPFAAVAGGSGGVAGSPFAWDHGAADAPTVSSSSGGSAHGRPAAGAAGEPVQDKAYTKMQGSTATSSSTDRATKRPASAAATTPAGLAARLLAPVQHAAAGVQQAAGSVRSGVADLLRAGSAAAAAAARHQDYGVGHQQQQKQQQRRQPSATHPLPPSAAPPPAAYGEQKGTQAAPAGPLRLSGAVAAVHRTTSQHLLRTGSNSTAAAGTPSASAASSKAPSVTGDGHADGASSSSSNPAAAATTAGGAGKAMLPPAGVGRVRGVTWAPAGALDDSAAGSSVTSSRRSSIEALGDVGDHATHRAGHQVAPGGTRKRQTLAQRKADQQAAAAAAGGASAGSSSTSKGRWAKVLLRKAAAAALVVVGGRLLQREVAEGWRSRQQQRRQQQQGPSSVHPVGSSGGGSGAGKLQPKAGGRNGSSEAWVWRAGDQVWLAAVQDKLL